MSAIKKFGTNRIVQGVTGAAAITGLTAAGYHLYESQTQDQNQQQPDADIIENTMQPTNYGYDQQQQGGGGPSMMYNQNPYYLPQAGYGHYNQQQGTPQMNYHHQPSYGDYYHQAQRPSSQMGYNNMYPQQDYFQQQPPATDFNQNMMRQYSDSYQQQHAGSPMYYNPQGNVVYDQQQGTPQINRNPQPPRRGPPQMQPIENEDLVGAQEKTDV